MPTCPCNVYPLTPHFYITKLGCTYTGVYIFSLIIALKHRFAEAVLTCTYNLCSEQKYENSKKIQLKIVIFLAVKIAVYCMGMFS